MGELLFTKFGHRFVFEYNFFQYLVPRFGFDDFFPSFSFNPFPDAFPRIFPDFSELTSGFFGRKWAEKLEEEIREAFKHTSRDYGITTENGTTTITQTIGGKKYTKEVPEGTSYFLSTRCMRQNGKTEEIVKIVIDGKTSVYTTIDGKTTVTDGHGNVLTDGGFFGIETSDEFATTNLPGIETSNATEAVANLPKSEDSKVTQEEKGSHSPKHAPHFLVKNLNPSGGKVKEKKTEDSDFR
ncbi:hypothetical protein TELCIR_00486 [Teladorsagia circumcincta]|uniref:Uncharacterized protein n=1 Tax=Teladorsagia circumcincta TaxID=45464 RepID=A0A2G9V4L5_TELCI|nr:hypothetical protein TELCIR_00486 [Teladorsagia circumcincta]